MRKLTPRHRSIEVRLTLRVDSVDRRLSSRQVSQVLTEHFWQVADDLTGLLTYGAKRPVDKPAVRVQGIVVRDR